MECFTQIKDAKTQKGRKITRRDQNESFVLVLSTGVINWEDPIQTNRSFTNWKLLLTLGYSNDKGATQDYQFKLFIHKAVIWLPKTWNYNTSHMDYCYDTLIMIKSFVKAWHSTENIIQCRTFFILSKKVSHMFDTVWGWAFISKWTNVIPLSIINICYTEKLPN